MKNPFFAPAALVAFAALVTGCGAGSMKTSAFASDWQSDNGKSIAAVRAHLASVPVPTGRGMALGITKTGLIAVALDGSSHWSYSGVVDSRPSIAGNVVVSTSKGHLFALDAATGRELWQLPIADKHLRGAGDDGRTTVASLGSDAGGGGIVVAVNRSGAVVGKWAPTVDVGIPAVLSDIVFAPWGNQYVSALSLTTGDEAGRLLARTVVSRATAIGGSIYFGENTMLRFDDAISQAATTGGHEVKLAERELPGKPAWYPTGTRVLPPEAGAPDAIRFYARPAEVGDKLVLDSQRFAATYFRIIVGFNEGDGALRWVRTLPAEVIGGDAAAGGFAFCDVNGDVWLTAARSGGDAGHVSLGSKIEGCVVDGGDFKIAGGSDTGTLAEQITHAIELGDEQMATVQRFLLRELGTNDDPTITKTLLDLACNARTQPDVLAEARSLLASRRTGIEYMIDALKQHYDFLSDVLRAPPVGPLADALSAVGEKSAAPLLAAHLNDPSDTPDDVKRAAHALLTLATASEFDDVRTFFSLYRATADDDALVAAVIDAAKILVHLGGADGVEVVERAVNDPLTEPVVKQAISSLIPAKTSDVPHAATRAMSRR
jgi:outer membrane protein assembly factor BamB